MPVSSSCWRGLAMPGLTMVCSRSKSRWLMIGSNVADLTPLGRMPAIRGLMMMPFTVRVDQAPARAGLTPAALSRATNGRSRAPPISCAAICRITLASFSTTWRPLAVKP